MLAAGVVHAQARNKLGSWHYPYGFNVPESIAPGRKAPEKTDVLVWTAPEAKRIRALLLIMQNSDSMAFGAHPTVREVAARREMGIVYFRFPVVWGSADGKDKMTMPALLKYIGEQTGIAGFEHAPWIPYGKSSVGSFPYRVAWNWPERTIATISFHAETLKWPAADWAKSSDSSILNANVNGQLEWGGTWSAHVRPSLLNYRARTRWLPHQVVSWGVAHGDYPDETSGRGNKTPRMVRVRIWDYLALFIDKAIGLRVPADPYPTAGPLKLRQVDEALGYLIHPFAVESLLGDSPKILARSADGTYAVNPGAEALAAGVKVASIPPLKDVKLPAGTPVVALAPGKMPTEWLTTGGMRFYLEPDPMESAGGFATLRPARGDIVDIAGKVAQFVPLPAGNVTPTAIKLRGLQKGTTTLALYTVLKVADAQMLQLDAPFTPNGRVQVLLNGQVLEHGQLVDVKPGLYPMMVVARLTTSWDALKAMLSSVKPEVAEKARGGKPDAGTRDYGDAGVTLRIDPAVPRRDRGRTAEAWRTLGGLDAGTCTVPRGHHGVREGLADVQVAVAGEARLRFPGRSPAGTVARVVRHAACRITPVRLAPPARQGTQTVGR